MRKIYLVRHGQTETNSRDVVTGEYGALSEKGRDQAAQLAERFLHVDFDHLISSDYERANETASFIAKTKNREIITEPLIRELRRPTEFHGVSRTSKEYEAFLSALDENVNDPNWHFSDEENFFDLFKRVEAFFNKIEDLDGDLVVVSHSRIIMTMTMYVMMGKQLTPDTWKLGMRHLLVSNTGITTLLYNSEMKQWKLQMFNDRAHFAE